MPLVLVIALVLAVLSAIFAIQNSDVVSVQFFSWTWDASLALVLILTLATGATTGYLAGLPRTLSKAALERKQRKRIAELAALAAIPTPVDTDSTASATMRQAGADDRSEDTA